MDFYMQRMKKSLVWLTLFSMIIALFPVGLISTAEAATVGATTYFSPDDRDILKTANYELSDIGNGADLRTKVKVVNTATLSITGSYSKVSGDSLSAQIDLLAWNEQTKTWHVDKLHSTPGTIQKDATNDSRFNASGLTLFPGLNKITLKGKFGNVEGSESFYVLYDKIPYYTKIAVAGSGFINDTINLNEGTRVVVKNPLVYLTGEVFNTTKATVSVNGSSPISTEVFDNKLSTPPLTLKAGLNKLSIVFTNGSDSITVTRDIFYFTDQNPFIAMYVLDNNNSNKPYDLLNNKPYLKAGNTANDLILQLLLPYSSSNKPFDQDSLVKIDGVETSVTMLSSKLYDDAGNFVVPTATADEVTIDDSTGPAYRLITFRVNGVPFQQTAGVTDVEQSPSISVNYGIKNPTETDHDKWAFNTTVTSSPSYFLSAKTTIKNLIYLPDYAVGDKGDVANRTQIPLNGSTVDKSSFYIMVETDSPVTDPLKGTYLPISNKTLSISSGVQANKSGTNLPNTYIYQITDFATGQQNVRFEYTDSMPKEATISYSSVTGILIDNLVDGQTYTFNSATKANKDFKITGEYFGFAKTGQADINAEYFINGINIEKQKNPTDYGSDPYLLKDPSGTVFPKFSLTINVGAEGPLVSGENTIEFRGQYRDVAQNLVPVSKKIRVYIVDENTANVSQFHPNKVPTVFGETRAEFPTDSEFLMPTNDPGRVAVDEKINNVVKLPTEFTFKNDTFTTSQQSYDLVIRGNGARQLNLMFGSELIFSVPIPQSTDINGGSSTLNGSYPATGEAQYFYQLVGNEKDFLLRIQSNTKVGADGTTVHLGKFAFDAGSTGTHVYNLELINNTGARTNQRLEITRELAPYRLLAPQPTVGDQIVVNKNFVRFDIEAEGATKVTIGKEEAVRRTEPEMKDRFTYDYVGLKPDKSNQIKIKIERTGSTINDTIDVYYTSSVGIDTQFMAEKVANKYTVFNKNLSLTFPKGTIMQSAKMNDNRITKFYPDTKLLFGIADPLDGVVERRNDYGVFIDKNTEINNNNILLDSYKSNFTSTAQTFNFIRISEIYWISGGVGELGDKGSATGYKPATNGLAPYSTEGIFTAFPAERKVVPSQRGTLTISYDKNVVDDAGTQVTVFKYTDVGGRGIWSRVPGTVNTSAHTITVPFDEFGYYAVYKLNRSFTDVTNHPWARNILNALYSKGIMDYLRTDAFGADDQTTRGEFATLLVKGLSLPINASDSQQSFFDVPYGSKTTTWDYENLETAARAGIITGRTEGFFSPNAPITRQEAAVMIARAAKLKLDTNDDKLSAKLAKSYLDSGKIEYYARPAVQAVSAAKIMSGSPVTLQGAKKASFNFNPTSNMTRAEAGKIAVELFKKNKSTKDMFPKNFN